MNINRINYEEYFLLYVDNELSASERRVVEDFVKLHPDLEEDLTMLQQSQLKPDHSLVLEDKSVLFKSEKENSINLQNYESFFLLYVDNELKEEERGAVQDFVSVNPQLHQEFEILLRTRIAPDEHVVYPDRQLLYRQVATERVVSFKMWRTVAVAAMLLIAAGVFWLNSGTDKSGERIAKGNQPTQVTKKNNPRTTDEVPTTTKEVIKEESNQNLIATTTKAQKEINRVANSKSEQKVNIKDAKENRTQIAKNDAVNDVAVADDPIVAAASINKVEIATTEGSANVSNNTLVVDQAFAEPKADKNIQLTGVDEISDEAVQSKSKLRGLFRQVSRVVEKTTHVPAAENKKLRIGNIQIALK